MIGEMGMHVGFIVAHCEWPDLRRVLEDHCGPLADKGPVAGPEWMGGERGRGLLHVATQHGNTYVLDELMALSSDSDVIVTLSRELSCRVIGAGAETVSGSYWFTAATHGKLARLHFDLKSSMTEPFDLGNPLPTEATSPFDHPDGMGILAGIRAGGFNVSILLQGAPNARCYAMTTTQFPAPGELSRQRNEHIGAHKRPDADQWEEHIRPVHRDRGYDVRFAPPDPHS
jgi:hypothetical protein